MVINAPCSMVTVRYEMVSVNLKPTFDGLSFILGLRWVLNELLGEYDAKAFLESVCQDLNSAEMGLNWCLMV